LNALEKEGLHVGGISILPLHTRGNTVHRTAQYVAINDAKKDLVLAMADMSIFSPPKPRPLHMMPVNPKWSVVDANWHPRIIRKIISHLKEWDSKVAYEPVSVPKSGGIFQPSTPVAPKEQLGLFPKHSIDLATPNQHELAAMHAAAKKWEFFESQRWWEVIDSLGIPSSGARDRFVAITNHKMTDEGIPLQTIQLLPFIPTILTKLGADGVLLTEILKPDDPRLTDPAHAPWILSRCSNGSTEVGGVYMRLLPAVEVVEDVVSVNGVGDTFLGVLIAGLAKDLGLDEDLINIAQRGAVLTLRSKESVSSQLGKLAPELDRLEQTSITKAMERARAEVLLDFHPSGRS
jgi:pseudouridine-5'-phosphate glycosidase/pseudouridine kinase